MAIAGSRSVPAYRHVNVGCIAEDIRGEILEDAEAGGREYGLKVVEIAYNGPAQTNIYGVYTHDEDLWAAAKAELGIDEQIDPSLDMSSAAAAKAQVDAEAALAAEQAALAAVGNGKK